MARRKNVTTDVPDFDQYTEQGLRAISRGYKTASQAVLRTLLDYIESVEGAEFWFSDPHLDGDGRWTFRRPLGQGGFGKVGLWQRRSEKDDSLIDEVAIKQSGMGEDHDISPDKPGLAREAWLQAMLNESKSKNVVHLRRFKYYSKDAVYRFYLEYAPHGDLNQLASRYRMYNTYLPELFLWHLFDALAEAALQMQDHYPFHDFDDNILAETFMLHRDLKPANVMLGYEELDEDDALKGTDPTLGYPTVKVADFGLAELTGPTDDANPKVLQYAGTTGYKPPEQTGDLGEVSSQAESGDSGDGWQKAPVDPNAKYDSSHNIWGCGKIMFDTIRLCNSNRLDNEMKEMTEDEYYGGGGSNAFPRIRRTKRFNYTSQLRNLVSLCCRIDTYLRPNPEELKKLTQDGLAAAKLRLSDPGVDNQGTQVPRLYFKGNEIVNMPLGDNNVPPFGMGDYNDIVKDRFGDRDWNILAPESAVRRLADDEERNNAYTEPGRPRKRARIDEDGFVYWSASGNGATRPSPNGVRPDSQSAASVPRASSDALPPVQDQAQDQQAGVNTLRAQVADLQRRNAQLLQQQQQQQAPPPPPAPVAPVPPPGRPTRKEFEKMSRPALRRECAVRGVDTSAVPTQNPKTEKRALIDLLMRANRDERENYAQQVAAFDAAAQAAQVAAAASARAALAAMPTGNVAGQGNAGSAGAQGGG